MPTGDSVADFIFWSGVTITVALFGLIGYGVYCAANSPTISILESEFTCSKSHQESSTFFINVNNIMIPQTTFFEVCDQYTRK